MEFNSASELVPGCWVRGLIMCLCFLVVLKEAEKDVKEGLGALLAREAQRGHLLWSLQCSVDAPEVSSTRTTHTLKTPLWEVQLCREGESELESWLCESGASVPPLGSVPLDKSLRSPRLHFLLINGMEMQ